MNDYKQKLLAAQAKALAQFHNAVRLRENAEKDLDAINAALAAYDAGVDSATTKDTD